MIKHLLILLGAQLFCLQSFSIPLETRKKILIKGRTTIVSPNLVEVIMDEANTLTITFNKDIDNVTITVKKQSGEIVFIENIDAKEWDICPTTIPDYKEGEYKIEISTPEGELEGGF